MANLKNINDLPVAESAEGLNLIANDNGAAKQIPAEFIGKVKTVNGASPDDNGNVEIEIPEGFSGSWNDLKDKPFYAEQEEVEIVPELEVVFSSDSGPQVSWSELIPYDYDLENEQLYIVTWNGRAYTCIGRKVDEYVYIGNPYIWANDYDDDGTPFCIYRDEDDGKLWCGTYKPDNEITVSISVTYMRETIHKIDAKYLPEINDIYANYDIVLHDILRSHGSEHDVSLIKGDCSRIMSKIKKCEIVRYLICLSNLSWDDTEGTSTQLVQLFTLAIEGNAPEEYLFFDMGSSKGYMVYQDNTAEYWEYDD